MCTTDEKCQKAKHDQTRAQHVQNGKTRLCVALDTTQTLGHQLWATQHCIWLYNCADLTFQLAQRIAVSEWGMRVFNRQLPQRPIDIQISKDCLEFFNVEFIDRSDPN